MDMFIPVVFSILLNIILLLIVFRLAGRIQRLEHYASSGNGSQGESADSPASKGTSPVINNIVVGGTPMAH